MITLLTLLGLLVLFYALGLSADLVITHVRVIGKKLGVPVFVLGLILGLLTSLPELGIGINALAQNVPSVSVGNLLGGVIVLFCLVLGLGIVLNREIKTDGRTETLWPILAYMSLPLLFGLREYIGFWTGFGLLLLYPAVLLYAYLAHDGKTARVSDGKRVPIVKELALIVLGLIGVVLLSNLIIRMTLPVLTTLGVPGFLVGLIVYSIGTNLPELIVTIRAWRNRVRELAFSNILGSAAANAALLGAFAMTKTLPVTVDLSYAITVFTMLMTFGLMLRFYRTGKRFTRVEGLILIGVYAAFALLQIPVLSAFAAAT
jgi:cation:H+ antiporter